MKFQSAVVFMGFLISAALPSQASRHSSTLGSTLRPTAEDGSMSSSALSHFSSSSSSSSSSSPSSSSSFSPVCMVASGLLEHDCSGSGNVPADKRVTGVRRKADSREAQTETSKRQRTTRAVVKGSGESSEDSSGLLDSSGSSDSSPS